MAPITVPPADGQRDVALLAVQAGSGLYDVDVARGGSAWGAGCLAGATGARSPSEIELTQAEVLVSPDYL